MNSLPENDCSDETKIYSGDIELDSKIGNWLKWDKNKKTRKQIEKLIEKEDWESLRNRLLNRISFETSGLLAEMRAGFDSMNDLVVIQTAQGLAAYMLDKFLNGKDRVSRGVVFGFDNRHNSKRYAQLAANVFQLRGFKVHLYRCMVATPLVPFAILKYKALAGVMVTGSQNPKEYNGFKVYWSNGARIIPPHGKHIQELILNNLQPDPVAWDIELLEDNPLVKNPYVDICQLYYDELFANLPKVFLQSNDCSTLRFVYSPLHGVGFRFVEHAFYIAKLNELCTVLRQKEPNPDFPTVKFPSLEEGKSVLKLSLELADRENIPIILINDPDADRLVCAEKTRSGRWKLFNGNELGVLLGWWSLQTFRQLNAHIESANCYFISSIISSKILRSIAIAEGMNFVEALPGFNWIGNKAVDLKAAGKIVLFAFEESIGYMFFSNVLDKDGISAATHLATMATYLRSEKNQTLCEKLDELYRTYGYHCTISSYMVCDELITIKKIFTHIRTWKKNRPGTYPESVLQNKYKIVNIRDLTTGLDTQNATGRTTLPLSSSGDMITFYFENKIEFTLRTTETEPKIKYYGEICGSPGEDDWDELTETLNEVVDAAIEEFLQPKSNNLSSKLE